MCEILKAFVPVKLLKITAEFINPKLAPSEDCPTLELTALTLLLLNADKAELDWEEEAFSVRLLLDICITMLSHF